MALNVTTNILSRSEYIFRHLAAAFLILTILLVLSPILLVFRLVTWLIVVIVMMCKNSGTSYYGKLISYGDSCVDEKIDDDSGVPPRTSIIATVTLEDTEHTLTLEQLRNIFIRKVLKATIPSSRNKRKKRYPELQQFLSTLLGFRVWKQDSNFNIGNHIVEQATHAGDEKEVPCTDGVALIDYSKIHQDLLNKPYQKDRSPWEIILMKPVNNQVVLACRIHNVLGDSISFLQLLTECLGHKTLKTTQTEKIISDNPNSDSYTKALKFCLLFPCKHLRHLIQTVLLLLGCWSHPWKMVTYRRHRFSTNLVTWSSPLPAEEIYSIAKANGASAPAVIMSVCAGAIRQCQEDVLGKKDVAVGYQLEKTDHPYFLANHGYLGILKLPTSEPCPMERLGKCHGALLNAKTFHLGKHLDLLGRMAGTFIPYPLTNYFMVNRFVPITMSHIIGPDQEGFSIAGDAGRSYSCSDFRMTSGTYRGVAGVMLCSCIYKDTVRIAVVANETVMERRQMEMLVDNLLLELEQLKEQNNRLKN